MAGGCGDFFWPSLSRVADGSRVVSGLSCRIVLQLLHFDTVFWCTVCGLYGFYRVGEARFSAGGWPQ